MNTRIKSLSSAVASYEAAMAAAAQTVALMNTTGAKVSEIEIRRESLRKRVVEKPDLAADQATKKAMSELLVEAELTGAALDGLKSRFEAAAERMKDDVMHLKEHFGRLLEFIITAHNQDKARQLGGLIRTWGPGRSPAGQNFLELDSETLALTCRHCCRANDFSKSITCRDMKQPDLEVVREGLAFVIEQSQVLAALGAEGWTDEAAGDAYDAEREDAGLEEEENERELAAA